MIALTTVERSVCIDGLRGIDEGTIKGALAKSVIAKLLEDPPSMESINEQLMALRDQSITRDERRCGLKKLLGDLIHAVDDPSGTLADIFMSASDSSMHATMSAACAKVREIAPESADTFDEWASRLSGPR